MKAIIVVAIASLFALGIFLITEKLKNRQNEKENIINTSNNNGLIDYDIYVMSLKEKILYTLLAAVVIYAVSFIFYKSFIVSGLLMPFALFYPRIKTKEIIKKRKEELNIQFKDALYALSSSLSAGKSIEMSFRDALKDLAILYPDSDTYIIKEFEYIVRRLEMNETVEEALTDFADRAHLEDISSFVDVFITCKKAGGNIVEIIKNTSNVIADKINIKQDIDVLLAEKRFEQKILNVVPIVMILVLSWSSEEYMRPVFTTIHGRIAMTIAVILLVISYFISRKIMDIEV